MISGRCLSGRSDPASLVASGVGLAIVPSSAMRMGITGAVFRAVRGSKFNVPMSFVWRHNDVSPTVAPFVRAVKINVKK